MEDTVLTNAEEKKKIANDLFGKKSYSNAEEVYSEAISDLRNSTIVQLEDLKSNSLRLRKAMAVLLSNRAAARLQLLKHHEALEDANESIAWDSTWLKSYVRKASALDSLGDVRGVVNSWIDAGKHCEESSRAFIATQLKTAQTLWVKVFLNASYPIDSIDDLCDRFTLLPNKRERLSLIVYFWNDAHPKERVEFFKLLLSIIGGQGGNSASAEAVIRDQGLMRELPTTNYPDLPRSRVSTWCDYFAQLSAEDRLTCLRKLWLERLSSEEQNDIITDLRSFFAQSAGVATANSTIAEGKEQEDIDFSYRRSFK
eukprot:gene25342-33876_t